jgi:hypothetical protein
MLLDLCSQHVYVPKTLLPLEMYTFNAIMKLWSRTTPLKCLLPYKNGKKRKEKKERIQKQS